MKKSRILLEKYAYFYGRLKNETHSHIITFRIATYQTWDIFHCFFLLYIKKGERIKWIGLYNIERCYHFTLLEMYIWTTYKYRFVTLTAFAFFFFFFKKHLDFEWFVFIYLFLCLYFCDRCKWFHRKMK